MNLAAVLKVPAIYVLQNNQVALGTRLDQHQVGPFTAWSTAYGVAGFSCDGNNVLDTYAATRLAAEHARNGDGAVIVVANTFRMGGHATHDEAEARALFAREVFEYWGRRDPIGMYEEYLKSTGVTSKTLDDIETRVIDEIRRAETEALKSKENKMPNPESANEGVYAPTAEATARKSIKRG
jgi:pyruvate dehydrogenase E1 component alpha subunit